MSSAEKHPETLQSSFVAGAVSLCLRNTNPDCLSNLTQSILDVRGTEGRLEVLLVGEDQEGDVLVVLVLHRPPQLHLGLVQLVGLGEMCWPQGIFNLTALQEE